MQKGKCVHFNGIQNDCCKAGVKYKDLSAGGVGLPCIAKYAKPETRQCDKRLEPTAEQVEADERAFKESMERTMKARQAIVERLGGPWKKGTPVARGSFKCPNCDSGELHFSRAGYNGHIHARCTTDGCVAWME